ncbi:hypothetical protein ACSX1A_07225 [Pontibacter sp. MBLB2868]|uniref:hypothetical protein n=1 Tax=Pontibacter sp. MBLB2868 TaxID=3451555 RepID=UPI003F751C38
MNKLFLTVTLAFTAQLAVAQTASKTLSGVEAQNNINSLGTDNINGMVRTYDNRYEGVRGTPYFIDQWGEAKITLQDNRMYDRVVSKYNVFENNLVYRNSKGTLYILDANSIVSFELQDSLHLNTYVFRKIKNNPGIDAKDSDRFFIMAYEGGKSTLAVLPQKDMIKADFRGGYSASRTYDEIVTDQTFYFVANGKAAEKIKLNKKNLLASLSDKKNEIEQYLKKENIDANSQRGWVQTLAYYDKL